MSQAQDMAAINNMIIRTTATNTAAAALQTSWIQWYNGLSTFDRDFDSDTFSDAKLRRDAFNKAISVGTVAAPAPVPLLSSPNQPTIKKGSKDPSGSTTGPVHIWQRIIGATPIDGIFGSGTEKLTKTWQKAYGLVQDGIVGPLSWNQAYANSQAALMAPTTAANAAAQAVVAVSAPAAAAVQTAPTAAAAIQQAAEQVASAMVVQAATPPAAKQEAVKSAANVAAAATKTEVPIASNGFPVLREGSKSDSVKTWQTMIGVSPADGSFGPNTTKATKAFQRAHGLTEDGIVGPATWTAASMPQAQTAIMIDPVSVSAGKVYTAVKGAVKDVMDFTPGWLKVGSAVVFGWTVLLTLASSKKSR